MTLRVVGSGVGRTGTASLQLALQRLLGGACYHMLEVFANPAHVGTWHAAYRGEAVDWDALFEGYVAAVDWPAGGCWKQLAAHYPDAVILHSERDAEGWWRSADETILEVSFRRPVPPEMAEWRAMALDMFAAFSPTLERDDAIAAFERHNADVRATAPADRLVIWRPGDGWGPICDALGLPVPDEPFPHVNSTAEFRAMANLDAPPAEA